MTDNNSYIFIANPLIIDFDLPFEIIDGHYLEKANDSQIQLIQECLLNTGHSILQKRIPYECKSVITEERNDRYSWSYKELNKKDWRYNIISLKGSENKTHELQLAANLSAPELELAFTFVQTAIASSPAKFYHYFLEISHKPIKAEFLNLENVKELSSIYHQMKEIETKYPEIKRAIRMYDDLKFLHGDSEFRVLGLFAIIESLITHKPKSTETGDSITHQLKSKIPLLSKRFTRKIDYSIFFKKANEDKIWTNLYGYRSDLAHGNRYKFSKKFPILKDEKCVIDFLKLLTKNLLRHSIIEPRLYTDLKAC